MNYETPITETDLHAYLDGQLSPARRQQVEAWLETHLEARKELEDYQTIAKGLHALFDGALDEPIPDRLTIPNSHPVMGWRLVAALAWVVLGSVIGWGSHVLVSTSATRLVQDNLVQPANFAHVVYTMEKRHPVEVGIEEEQHLVQWLSKRLHTNISAPNLSAFGYKLMGGRLLPSTNRMAAQFMYQTDAGSRITLYVRRISEVKARPHFQFSNQDGINTLFWIENSFGYALSGDLNKLVLWELAEAIYPQLKI